MDAEDFEPGSGRRRTMLANERTYLAWQRTGLATLTVALAAARIIPELAGAAQDWPYVALGVAFGLYGIVCVLYGEVRRRAVARAIVRDELAAEDERVTTGLAVAGALLGVAVLAVVVLGP